MLYLCGLCRHVMALNPRDLVRCLRCEGRILHKLPNTTVRIYSAR
jgi:DNA-directed RNA polymerase subunit RPC12/RpoP